MLPVYPAARTVLVQFDTVLRVPSILFRRVVALFALITLKSDDLPGIASLGHRHLILTGAQLPEILQYTTISEKAELLSLTRRTSIQMQTTHKRAPVAI